MGRADRESARFAAFFADRQQTQCRPHELPAALVIVVGEAQSERRNACSLQASSVDDRRQVLRGTSSNRHRRVRAAVMRSDARCVHCVVVRVDATSIAE
jgi:hypothetical protein